MPHTFRSATRRLRRPSVLVGPLAVAALAVAAPPATAAIRLEPPVTYATAAGTQDVVVGDFDSDGWLDLATANAAAQSISVLLGDGDGTFQPAVSLPVMGEPGRLSVADFDGDEHPDLAVTVPGTSKVDVLWGGIGGFTGATTSVTALDGAVKAIGTDLNGDGRDELAVTDGDFDIRTFVSGAGRSFGSPTNVGAGFGPGDLVPISSASTTSHDTVAALETAGGASLQLGNGAGGLDFAGIYGVGAPGGIGAPNGIAAADITGDGNDDVVTSNGGTGNVTILAHRSAGMFNIQQNTALADGFGPSGVTTGDFTGDGVADAAVVGRTANAVTVLRSGGPFSPMVAVDTYAAGADPIRAAGADFNGDGAADLAVASTTGGVRVLLSQGSPTLAGQASASVTVGGDLSDTVTLAGATPNAGGTITFRLYGPGDTTCATPLSTQTTSVDGNGAVTTPTAFQAPHAGTYRWVASYSGDDTNDAVDGGCSDANQTTVVAKATPTTSVTAPPTILLGNGAVPEVALAGGFEPVGSLTLRAYPTSDCSGVPAYSSGGIVVAGNGEYPGDTPFTPTAPGEFRWQATYSGDADNAGVTGACGAATTMVPKRTPHLTAAAPPPIVVGDGSVRPSASLSNGFGATGTVTFTAHADEACSDTPVFESEPVNVGGDGSYSPVETFTPPHAGTYRFVAHYSGDGANDATHTDCGDAGTTLAVEARSPTITVSATAAITLGDAAPVTATLDDGWQASGEITLSAYATDDCSGPAAFVGDPIPADGDGSYTADPAFVPPHAATYRWVAEFAGDDDNAPAASACGAAGSVTAVARVTPTLVGAATSGMLGEPVEATATLSGTTEDATGTITFTAYADAACAGPAVFTGEPIAVDDGGAYVSERFVPNAVGDYRWVARYSGDGDNAPAATVCGAAELTSTIAPRPIVPQPPVVEAPLPLSPVPPVVMLSRIAVPRCLTGSAPGRRGSVRYGVSSRSRVTFTVQRRTNSPWPVRTTCPRRLESRLDGVTAGRYATVRVRGSRTGATAGRPLRRAVTVARGTHRIALRTLIGSAKLAPGRYRVLIQARSTAGATTRSVAYLWVLRR